MSWLLACRPTSQTDLLARVRKAHGAAGFAQTMDGWYLACGGPKETAAGEVISERHARLAVGMHLGRVGERFSLRPLLEWPSDETDQAGFLRLTLQDGRLELASDVTGLRTAYVTEGPDGVVISSRLDWLSQITGRRNLDFRALGSHWRCHNQFSMRPFVRDVQRVPSGGHLTWEAGRLTVGGRAWTPDPLTRVEEIESVLRSALQPEISSDDRLTLGVSGGLDSRLLACIVDDDSVDLHSFGPPSNRDVQIARRLSRALRREITIIDEPLPDPGDAIALARAHAAATCALAPASAAMSLRFFDRLHARGAILVDGGFGEIGRRQFMNRLLTSRKSIVSRAPSELAASLSFQRADVFVPEITEGMTQGVLEDIEAMFVDRPEIEGWTDADQADLVAVRFRLPNFFGMEQARLDGLIASYMPFATPSFLNTVFATPLALRRGGRLFRKIIRDLRPAAAALPLVKGDTTYPFMLSPLTAFVYTSLKKKLARGRGDDRRDVFLQALEPLIRDTASSSETRATGYYDVTAIDAMIDGYYSGERVHGHALDWWLAFELWRQALSATDGNSGSERMRRA